MEKMTIVINMMNISNLKINFKTYLHKIDSRYIQLFIVLFVEMNSHYQTRLQSRMQNKETTMSYSPESCSHQYNTRLQNRLQKLEQPMMVERPTTHHYNTRSHDKTVSINFDEASEMWNKNKRRSGQMYYYK